MFKGHLVGSLSAFRVLLSVRETDTSETTPAPSLSAACKQGVKSAGEVGVVHSDQGWGGETWQRGWELGEEGLSEAVGSSEEGQKGTLGTL